MKIKLETFINVTCFAFINASSENVIWGKKKKEILICFALFDFQWKIMFHVNSTLESNVSIICSVSNSRRDDASIRIFKKLNKPK